MRTRTLARPTRSSNWPGVFSPGGARLPSKELKGLIDHRQAHGFGSICKVLQLARLATGATPPSSAPALRCQRAQRDGVLSSHIELVWRVDMQVYGADKVWKQLNREGISIARCAVERLMKRLGLARCAPWRCAPPSVMARRHARCGAGHLGMGALV